MTSRIRDWFAIAVAVAVLLLSASCAMMQVPPQFADPASTDVFWNAGITCFANEPDVYGVGAMYERRMNADRTEYIDATDPNAVTVALRCGEMLYTVTCDVTKPLDKRPCRNVRVWRPGSGL